MRSFFFIVFESLFLDMTVCVWLNFRFLQCEYISVMFFPDHLRCSKCKGRSGVVFLLWANGAAWAGSWYLGRVLHKLPNWTRYVQACTAQTLVNLSAGFALTTLQHYSQNTFVLITLWHYYDSWSVAQRCWICSFSFQLIKAVFFCFFSQTISICSCFVLSSNLPC